MTLWRCAIGIMQNERSCSVSPNQILEPSIDRHRLAWVIATIFGTDVVPEVSE